MLKRIFIIFFLFVVGMVGGIFAEQIFWPYLIKRPLFYQYNLESQPIYLTEQKQVFIQENTVLVEAIEKVKRSVVVILVKTKSGKILHGSGLIVTSDGLVVTLAELVPAGSEFNFYIDHQKVSYQILKRDQTENLVLIKISDSGSLSTVSFARLEDLKIGERVFLFGNFCQNETCFYSANEGIVKYFDNNFIQTNIKENNQLAGSPLFNINGEVLGINIIDANGNVIAIPISKIRNFIGL